MPRRMHAHRGLAQPSRLQVVALVMEQPGLSLADLSAQTGLHANTLRDHVRVRSCRSTAYRRRDAAP